MKSMKQFSLFLVLALVLQLVIAPLGTKAADVEQPTWVKPIHYVALGDSLAFGIDSNGQPGEGYPDYLARLLLDDHVLQTYNKGFTYPGYTTPEVLKDFTDNVTKEAYGIGQEGQSFTLHQSIAAADFITISVGANDVLKHFKLDPETGTPIIDAVSIGAEIQEVGKNYHQILQAIYQLNPTVQVYVMGYYNPFPYLDGVYQPQLQQMLLGLNGAIQASMSGTSAVFIPTSEIIASDYNVNLPNPQNIHLSKAGYEAVANQFYAQIKENYEWFAADTLTAEMKGDTAVTLSWQPPINAEVVTQYWIYNGAEKIGEVNGDTQTFDVENLANGKTYEFSISAVNAAGHESTLKPSIQVETGESVPLFTDIEGHWSKEFVERAVAANIIYGHKDGTFKPKESLSRAQAAAIIVRTLGLKATTEAPFTDIRHYNAATQEEIAAAYQFGITKGVSGNKFNPSEPVTRVQLALMIKRSYELATGMPYQVTEYAPFPDIETYDQDAKTAITMLYNFGIVEGSNGYFMPTAPTERGQAAKIFVSFLEYMKQ